MEELPKCFHCHTEVRATDYYCYNCGSNLHPKPPSLEFQDQLVVYLKSFLLPPLGITIGIKYLRADNLKAKIIGSMAIILTVLSLILVIRSVVYLIDSLTAATDYQMQMYGF